NNDQRGLYKTTDGGTTWSKSLFINDSTGVIDIAIHPTNPNILWATSWERSRAAWDFKGSGPGSGIWKTTDGGQTWARSEQGFPSGKQVGRIGLAVFPSNPNIVYALLDNQEEVRIESRRPPESEGLQASAIRSMSANQFNAISNEELDKYLRDNRYPAKYTAASAHTSVRASEFTI